MAAPAYQALGTGEGSGGGSTLTVGWPSHTTDDIGVLVVVSRQSFGDPGAATLNTANGFAAVSDGSDSSTDGIWYTRVTLFWCRATSGSMSSPVVATSSANVHSAVIITYRGCIASGDPIDGTPGLGANASSNNSVTAPGPTTSTSNTGVLVVIGHDGTSTASGYSNGNLTSITERMDSNPNAVNAHITLATATAASSGSLGNTTATLSGSQVWASVVIALKGIAAEERTSTVSGTATVTATGTAVVGKSSTIAGTSSFSPTGASRNAQSATAAGTSAFTPEGTSRNAQSATAAGSASVSAEGQAVHSRDTSAAGTSTFAPEGASTNAQSASVAGSSSFSPNGAATAAQSGSAAGSSVVTPVAQLVLPTGSSLGNYVHTYFGFHGSAYCFGWFGPTPSPRAVIIANQGITGGVSRSRILGNVNPRPQVPPWRQIDGPTGVQLTEIRRFLHDAHGRDELWGNHVEVEFPGAGVSVPVATGLGGPAKGYKVVRSNADVRVWDGTPGTPDETRGVIWLQASGAARVTLYLY